MKTRGLRAAMIILFYAVTLIQASKSPGKCETSSYISQKEPLKPISNKKEENQNIFSMQEKIANSPDPNTEDNAENYQTSNIFVDKTVIRSNSNLINVHECAVPENDDVKVSDNVNDDAINTGYYDVSHSVTYNPRDNSYEFHVPIEVEKLDDCQNNFSLKASKQKNECIADTSNKSYDLNPSRVEVSKPLDDINLRFDEIELNDCQDPAFDDFDLVTNNVHNNEDSTCVNYNKEGCIYDNKCTNALVQNIDADNAQYDTSSKQYIFEIPSEDITSLDAELTSNSAVSRSFHDLHEHNTNEAIIHTFDSIEEHDNIHSKSKSFLPDINIEIDNEPIEIKTNPSIADRLTTALSTTINHIDKNGNDYTYAKHKSSENDINNSVNLEMNENINETPERETLDNNAESQSSKYINYKSLKKSSYDPATNSYEFNIPQKIGVIPSGDLCSCYDNNLDDRETEKYTVLQENDIDGSIKANEHSLNAPIDNAGYHCKSFSSNSEKISNFHERIVPDTNEIIVTPKSFINAQSHAKHFELKNVMSPSRSIWNGSYDNEMNLVENTCPCNTDNQSLNNTYMFLDDTKTDENKTPKSETLLYDSDSMKATDFEISVVPSDVKGFISSDESDIESKLPQNVCVKYDSIFNTYKNSNQLKPENYVCDQIEVENVFNDLKPSKTGEKSSALILTPTCDSKEKVVPNLPNYEQVENGDALSLEPSKKNDSKLEQYRNKQELRTSYMENNFITPNNYEFTIPSAVVRTEEKPQLKTNNLNRNVFEDNFNNCLQNSEFIVTNTLDPLISSKKTDQNSIIQAPSTIMYSNIANNDKFKPVKFLRNPKLSNDIDYFSNVPPYSQKVSSQSTAALLPNENVMNNDFAKTHDLNAQNNINFVDSNIIEPLYNVKDTLGTNIYENPNLAQKCGINNLKLLTVPDSCTYKNIYTIDSISNTSVYPNSSTFSNTLKIPTQSQTVNPILTENRSFSKPLPITSELKLNSAMPYLAPNFLPAVSAPYSIPRNPSDNLLRNPISDPITAKVFDVLNSPKLISKNEPLSSIYSMNKTPVAVNRVISGISPSLYSIKPSKNIMNVPISSQIPRLNLNQVPQNESSTFETIIPTSPTTTLPFGSVPLVCPQKTSVNINSNPLSNYRSPSIPLITNKRAILLNSPNAGDSFSTMPVEYFLGPVLMSPNQYIPYIDSIKAFPTLTPKPAASYNSNSLEATSHFTPSSIDGPQLFITSQLPTNKFNSQSSPTPGPVLPYSDLTPLINYKKLDFLKENTLPDIFFSDISCNIPPKLGTTISGVVSPINFHPNSMIEEAPFSSIIESSTSKPIYLNTNGCPESAVSFTSNPCNSDISITEVKPLCSDATSPNTSILPYDTNTNVCRANAIFFLPNPCKCEILSAESPLPLEPVKAVVSSSTCCDKTKLVSPKTPKLKPIFKPYTAAISNGNVISEQNKQYSPTNINLALSSIPIHDATMSPKSNNLFDDKLTDSISITRKFKTSLPQYFSIYQPSLSLKTIEKCVPIKKTLTTPNIFTNITSDLPLSNSHSKPIFNIISTIPSNVTPSPTSLTFTSNIANNLPVLGSSILNTAQPIVYNPFTQPISKDVSISQSMVPTSLPSDLLITPTISSNSLLNPSSLSSPLFSSSLLNQKNAYSHTNPIVASTLVNTNPTLLSSNSSPKLSPVIFYPGPASALKNTNCEYRDPWSACVSINPQTAPASASTHDSTTTPIGKSPASFTLSTEINPCITLITVPSIVYPCSKPTQPQVLVPGPISTNTNLKTIPFSAPLCIEPFSSQSSAYPCSTPVPVSVYSSTNIGPASIIPSSANTSPSIVPSSQKAYASTFIPVKCPCTNAVSKSSNSNPLSLISYTEPLKTSKSVSNPVSITKPIPMNVYPNTKAVSSAYPSAMPIPVDTYPLTRMVPTVIHSSVTPVDLNDYTNTKTVHTSAYPSVTPVVFNYDTFTKPVLTSSTSLPPSATQVALYDYTKTKTVPTSAYPSVTPVVLNDTITKPVSTSLISLHLAKPVSVNTYSAIMAIPTSICESVTQVHDTNHPTKSETPANGYPSSRPVPMNSNSYETAMYPCALNAMSLVLYPGPTRIPDSAFTPVPVTKLNPVSVYSGSKTVPISANDYHNNIPVPVNTYSKTVPASIHPSVKTVCATENLITTPISANDYNSATTFSENPYSKVITSVPPTHATNYPFTSSIPASIYSRTHKTPLSTTQTSARTFSDISQLSSSTSSCVYLSSKEIPENWFTYKKPLQPLFILLNPLKYHHLLSIAPTKSSATKIQPNVVTSIFEPLSAANLLPLDAINKPNAAFAVPNPFQSFAHSSKPITANSNTPKTYSSLDTISPSITSPNKLCNNATAINSSPDPNYTNIKYLNPSPFINPALSSSKKDPSYFETTSMGPKYLSCSRFKNITIPTNSNTNIMTSLSPYNIIRKLPTSFDPPPYSTKSIELARNFTPSAYEPVISCVTPLNKINPMSGSTMSRLIPTTSPCILNAPYSFIPKVTHALPTSSYLPKYTAHAVPSFNMFKTTDPLPVSPISCSTPVERPITNSCRLNQNKPCDYILITSYVDPIPLISVQNVSPTSSLDTFNNVLSSPALTTLLRDPYFNKFTLKPSSGFTPSSTNTITNSMPHYNSGNIINEYKTSSNPLSSYMRPIYSHLPSVDQKQSLISSNPSYDAAFAPVRPNGLVFSPIKYCNQLKTSISHGTPSPVSSHILPLVSHFNSPLKATPFGTRTDYSCSPSSFNNLAPSYYKMPIICLKTSNAPFSTINSSSRPVSLNSSLSFKLPSNQSTYTQTSNVRPTEPPTATFYSNLSSVSQTTIPTLRNIASVNLNATPSSFSLIPILKPKASLPANQILTSVPNSAYEYVRLPFNVLLPPSKYISPVPNGVNIASNTKHSNNVPNINVFPKVSPPTNIKITYPKKIYNHFPIQYSYDNSKHNANQLHPYTPSSNSKVSFGSPQNTCSKKSSPVPITSATVQEVTSTATPFATSALYYPEPLSIAENVNILENIQNPYIDQINNYFYPSAKIGSDKTNSYNELPYNIDSTNSAPKNIYYSLQKDCLKCQHLSNLLKTNINKIVTPDMFKNYDLQNLTILVKNIGIVKYTPDKENIFRVKTSIPGIELKAWPSRITVLKPKIVLEATKYNVVNFQPVVRHNNFDLDIVQNIAKGVVEKNYGKPIVLKGIYDDANSFAIVDDIARVCGDKCLILWPTYCDYNKL